MVLAVAGLAVNLPGLLIRYTDFFAMVPYTPYSEIHLDVNDQPTQTPELDNLYRTNFLPPFSPIAGHAWLLRHALFGGDPAADCPWEGWVTNAPMIRTPGLVPRIDLWFMPDADGSGATDWLALGLLAVLVLAAVAASYEAWRSASASDSG